MSKTPCAICTWARSPLQAALDSAAEIAVPVLMATVTTVVVFLPLVFMTGMGKYLFTPLAVSATFAMAASYVVSRTVSPLYCSRFLRLDVDNGALSALALPRRRVLALAGFVLPAAGHYLARLLEGTAPALLIDVLDWPETHLSEVWNNLLFGVGMVGVVILLMRVVFWCAPAFQHFFEKITVHYESALRLALRRRCL